MKFSIQNIGHIKQAEIDLDKELIVLCGGNNSGKTYIAYSVYGLLEMIADWRKGLPNIRNILSENDVKDLFVSGHLSVNLHAVYQKYKKVILHAVVDEYKQTLHSVFASPKSFVKSTVIQLLQEHDSIVFDKILQEDQSSSFHSGQYITLATSKRANNKELQVSLIVKNNAEYSKPEIARFLEIVIFSHILYPLLPKGHFFPAERIAINLFSDEISSNLKENDDLVYPLPIKDSLLAAKRLKITQKQTSDYAFLADEIEQSLLKGRMSVADTGEVRFSPQQATVSLGIHLSASMIKSLASIIFYCRHLARKGDLLIIDEPELNLHPDNQRKVARILAQMVNAGLRVMISTHSDYIIRELNNLMMLQVPGREEEVAALMQRHGYKQEQLLDHRKVGVYLIANDTATPLEVSPTGFEVKSIDEQINQLNDSSRDIFFTLHDD